MKAPQNFGKNASSAWSLDRFHPSEKNTKVAWSRSRNEIADDSRITSALTSVDDITSGRMSNLTDWMDEPSSLAHLENEISNSCSYSRNESSTLNDNNVMDKPHKCPRCGKDYKLQKSLRNHIAYECGRGKNFVCPHCPYRAKLKGHLKNHIIARHGAAGL